MRLLIIRHGDPDYSIDSLTEKGWKEAEALSKYMEHIDVTDFYVSPLGRAQDTASVTLKHLNRSATTLPWLKEFTPRIHHPSFANDFHSVWDWLPEDWATNPDFYNPNKWYDYPLFKEANVKEEYQHVITEFRSLLKERGYEKEGNLYKVTNSNHDTLCFFCHFGIECVLLSDIFNISPMVLWHNFVALPTSVTSLYTEERTEGIASFRMNEFASTTHLYVDNQKPSFSSRFVECYKDEGRH